MGPGMVLDTKVLVQLALVQLERDGTNAAFPIEELCDPDACPEPELVEDLLPTKEPQKQPAQRDQPEVTPTKKARRRRRRGKASASEGADKTSPPASTSNEPQADKPAKKKRRRRRRRRKGGSGDAPPQTDS